MCACCKTRTNLAGDKCYGHDKWVKVRHLPIFGRRVYLRYRPKRYVCPYCDGEPTTTQVMDWHPVQSTPSTSSRRSRDAAQYRANWVGLCTSQSEAQYRMNWVGTQYRMYCASVRTPLRDPAQ